MLPRVVYSKMYIAVVLFSCAGTLLQPLLPAGDDETIDIGNRLQLLLDGQLLDSTENLSFTLHHPTEAEKVLEPTSEKETSLYRTTDAGGRRPSRRLVLRTDGFVSLRAPYSGGELTTKPITFSGNRLLLNILCRAAGSVRAELQTRDGKPIPGFTLDDCPEIFGDSIELPVKWKQGADLGSLAGRPLRLRLALRDSDLYAFRFDKSPTKEVLVGGGRTKDEKRDPIDIGSRKQLFIDDRFIESSRGVTLTMNPPRRDGRVLIEADQSWEKNGAVQVYCSVLKDQNKVRLWYDISEPNEDAPIGYERRVAYAESDDGIHFEKPTLNLYEVNGSKANNVVFPGVIGGASVWIDPRAPAEHRYKNVTKVYPSQELHVHSSSDGLRWNLFAKINPGPGGWDTQSIIFWDPAISRYVLYTRYWVHRGKPNRFRTVRRLESDDLRTWDQQSIVMQADEMDLATHKTGTQQPPVDYYGACVFRYDEAESVYIMFAQAYWHWRERSPLKGLGPDSFDVRLCVSRDGKSFRRAGARKPFIAMGPAGRFDSAHVWALPDPIRMGDELWIYYAGANMDHSGNIDQAAKGKHLTGIGLTVLRLDGFVSADADYSGGEITTPLLRFKGRRLELNAETSGGGSVRVELIDEAGRPIAGYSGADALPINGNSVRLPVRWRGGSDVSKLAGSPVRLRFHLGDCKLYAFQFRG